MTDPKQTLSSTEITDRNLTGWNDAEGALHATYATGDFATGLKLVNLIGESAEQANHHPDIELTYPTVAVTLTSHDVGGVTSRDIELARTITAHADSLGISS